jgi:hypothetical protein
MRVGPIVAFLLVFDSRCRSQMDQLLRDAAPAVVQAASSSLGTTSGAALKCLEAWIGWGIPAEYVFPSPYTSILIRAHQQYHTFDPTAHRPALPIRRRRCVRSSLRRPPRNPHQVCPIRGRRWCPNAHNAAFGLGFAGRGRNHGTGCQRSVSPLLVPFLVRGTET